MNPAETKREMVRRMLAKGLPATMELIADDAVYFWSNGSAMFGKSAIEAAMKANFDSLVGDTYDVRDITWIAENDDVAACVFRFRCTAVVDGQPGRRQRSRRLGPQARGRAVAYRPREPQPGTVEATLIATSACQSAVLNAASRGGPRGGAGERVDPVQPLDQSNPGRSGGACKCAVQSREISAPS